MDWQDEAFVLSAARFGEGDAVLEALTRAHGRHLGLVKGGMSKTKRPVLQTGNRLSVEWKARLSDHLGRYEAEPLRAYASLALDSAPALAALTAASAVASACLPEREPHAAIFEGFGVLMEAIAFGDPVVAAAIYVKWEAGLLQDLGFGLDLSRCAVSGTRDDLAFVSPRSGRAVNRAAAGDYASRLLRLPAFLLGSQAGDPDAAALADGFRLTGHFLAQSVLAPHGRDLPAARGHYVDLATR
ncbi:MAG: DNA repair protein RecO [Alphaproteobacteria bacterium]|nr:DNA repair protein RecO [Alphaproteobacteria bacterium]